MKKMILMLVFAFASVLTFAQPIDAVAYFPFNGNAEDESMYGWHDGTVYGATLVEDRFGNLTGAYDFDGVDDYILCANGHTIELDEDFTISYWVLYDDLNVDAGVIVRCRENTWVTGDKGIYVTNNSPYLGVHGLWVPPATPLLYSGVWINVVCTYEVGGYINFYINTTKYSDNTPYTLPADDQNVVLYLGRNGLGYYFDGTLDDIRIYNYALDSNEIAQLYEEGTVGINETSNKNISVYPNPVCTNLKVEMSGNNIIRLFDTNGKQCVNQEFTDNLTIDMTEFKPGMYFYQLGDVRGKIVKR